MKDYKDRVLYDIVDTNICHLLLGHPLEYELKEKYDGVTNKYQIVKDGQKFNLLPNPDPHQEKPKEQLVVIVGEQEILQTIQDS